MNKRAKIISSLAGIVLLLTVLVVGSGENKTILTDSELSGSFGIVTISTSGTADDWLNVDASKATMKQLKLSGNYIHVTGGDVSGGSSHGVLITGKNIIVEGMKVHNGVTENGSGKCSGTGGWGSAIKVQVGGENVVIRDNDVYKNCGEGIGITRGVNVRVENNRVWDNFSVNIYMDNSPNSQAINNRVSCGNPNYFRNWPPAGPARGFLIGLEYYAGWGNQMHDVLIDGNTVENCGAIRLYKDSEMSGQTISNVTISNNFFFGVPAPFVSVAGATAFNNVAGNTGTQMPPVTSTPATSTATRTPTASRTPVPPSVTPTVTTTPLVTPVVLWRCTVSPIKIDCQVAP